MAKFTSSFKMTEQKEIHAWAQQCSWCHSGDLMWNFENSFPWKLVLTKIINKISSTQDTYNHKPSSYSVTISSTCRKIPVLASRTLMSPFFLLFYHFETRCLIANFSMEEKKLESNIFWQYSLECCKYPEQENKTKYKCMTSTFKFLERV